MIIETLVTAEVAPLKIRLTLCDFEHDDEHYEVEVLDTKDVVPGSSFTGIVVARVRLYGSSYGEAKNAFDALVTTALAVRVG